MLEDFLTKSIDRIKLAGEMSLAHYGKPLVCEYSGGKDSDSLLRVFELSGVPFEVHYSLTTVDPPPVVKHIRDTFHRLEGVGVACHIDKHIQPDGSRLTMWNLIPQKLMPPTRLVRYCCAKLKETGNKNRFIATGVRWAESTKRSSRSAYEVLGHTLKDSIGVTDEKMLLTDNEDTRRLFENCQMKAKTVVNPIIDWSDEQLWDFLRDEGVEVCEMYSCGYERLGCIGCPLARKAHRERELEDFPTYARSYTRAFDEMLKVRKERGKETQWTSGEEVMEWWMQRH